MVCKKCGSENIVKSGIVGGRQRFRCKGCGCNFRLGDNRTDEKIAAKKPSAFYGMQWAKDLAV